MKNELGLTALLLCTLGGCGPSTSDAANESSSITDKKSKADLAVEHDLASASDLGLTRQTCTSDFGTGLSATHARLDGYLVSIVPPSNASGCNRDDAHVHLQVKMNDGIYDVAVDIGKSGDPIYYLAKNITLPDGAWAEGWHTSDGLSYESLGVTSTELEELSPTVAASTVETALAKTNEISVFGTGYNANGMHLVHYESGKDGALVIDPLSATPEVLFFRFTSDKF